MVKTQMAITTVGVEIRRGTKLLGRLEVSAGSLNWYPPNAREPRTVDLKKFVALIEEVSAR